MSVLLPWTPYLVVFFVVAAFLLVVSVAAITRTLRDNHRDRLARHESVPTYYRHVLAH